MKKSYKFFMFFLMLIMILGGSVFAVQNEYVLKKELVYENKQASTLRNGFIEIMIGQLDFTQYVDDEYIKITPTPDEVKEDKYGNKYIYYSTKGMLPKEKKFITIERKMTVSAFETAEPILARSNGSVTDVTKLYVEPQEKIESDEKEIINKANEITKDLSSDYRKAVAIFEFVNTTMNYSVSSSSANTGALAALKNKSGVCEEFATLFVALCRAEEIPARVVAGYKVEYEKDKQVLVDHAWAEIFLDDYGWLPVEPTVIYTVNGNRLPYWDSFCKLTTADYIPTEIYMQENPNRVYSPSIDEKSFDVSLTSANNIVAKQNTFADIAGYDWAADSIQRLYELGIVEGYSDFEYGPQRNISRIEFITMLSRTLEVSNENYVEGAHVYYYPSYDRNHWSKDEYDFLMRCYQFYTPSDIMSAGYFNISEVFGDGADLNVAITRGEAVALMDLFLDEATKWDAFTDVNSNTRFYKSIAKAYSSGIINGYLDNSFRPENTITRAEMAAVLGRFVASNCYLVK